MFDVRCSPIYLALNSLPRRSERRRVNPQLSTIIMHPLANLAKLLHNLEKG
jgi:hypothetical protein